MELPVWIDCFLAPIRDNPIAQVAIAGALLLILLDVVFGLASSLVHKCYSSTKMREGMGHKCGEMGFMLVGVVVDGMICGGFDIGVGPVLIAMCTGIIIVEIGSLMEILSQLWPEVRRLKPFKLLESVKEEMESQEEDDE